MRTVYKDHVSLQEVKAEGEGDSTHGTTVRIQKLEKELAGNNESLRVERKKHKQEVQGLKAQLWDRTSSKSRGLAIALQGQFSAGGKRLTSTKAGPPSKRVTRLQWSLGGGDGVDLTGGIIKQRLHPMLSPGPKRPS